MSYTNTFYLNKDRFLNIPKTHIYARDYKPLIYRGLVEGKKILDFGSGTCTLPAEMRNTAAVYDTYDPDAGNKAAKYHSLAEITGHYDVAISSHCFEHFKTYNELYEALIWLREHVDLLITTVPNHSIVYDSIPVDITHKLILNTPCFSYMLESAGFHPYSIILSEWNYGDDLLGSIRYAVRFMLSVMLIASPFHNYTIICDKGTMPEEARIKDVKSCLTNALYP